MPRRRLRPGRALRGLERAEHGFEIHDRRRGQVAALAQARPSAGRARACAAARSCPDEQALAREHLGRDEVPVQPFVAIERERRLLALLRRQAAQERRRRPSPSRPTSARRQWSSRRPARRPRTATSEAQAASMWRRTCADSSLTTAGSGRTISDSVDEMSVPGSRRPVRRAARRLRRARRRRTSTTLLDKAGDYVERLRAHFVGVVAEETYRQEVRGARAARDLRGFPVEARPAAARSEVGRAARPRAGRRSLDAVSRRVRGGRQAGARSRRAAHEAVSAAVGSMPRGRCEDIAAASARYNIGGVNRTINLPVLALTVLEPRNRAWFSFSRAQAIARQRRSCEYQEEERGRTLIRGSDDQPMPSRGRFTDRRRNGARARQRARRRDAPRCGRRSTSPTRSSHRSACSCPREMRENYTIRDGSVTEGRATYAQVPALSGEGGREARDGEEMMRVAGAAVAALVAVAPATGVARPAISRRSRPSSNAPATTSPTSSASSPASSPKSTTCRTAHTPRIRPLDLRVGRTSRAPVRSAAGQAGRHERRGWSFATCSRWTASRCATATSG